MKVRHRGTKALFMWKSLCLEIGTLIVKAGILIGCATVIAIAVAMSVMLARRLVWVAIWVLPFLLVLRILGKLCDFMINHLSWKQREWEESVRALFSTMHWSEIRRPPVRSWVWTIGLVVVLLFTLSDEKAIVPPYPEQFGLFGPVLILFACSCRVLFVKTMAWHYFGATYFIPDAAFSPGGKVTGRIYFQRESPIKYDLISRVECVDTTTKIARRISERRISPDEFGIGTMGWRYIPIDCGFPSEAWESSWTAQGITIVWQLRIEAARPRLSGSGGRLGVPYRDRFRVPVVWRPDLLGVDIIVRERNAEIRRAMIDRYGQDRFVLNANAKILDQWRNDELLAIDLPDDPDGRLVALKLRCPSTATVYIIRVPPDQQTVQGALAWSFGLDKPGDYVLQKET